MPNYKLYGIAYAPENVEFEVTNMDTPELAQVLATQEVLQQHPEYESVDWFKVDAD